MNPGFPGSSSGKEPTCRCRRHRKLGFDPQVGKIPWRRAQQSTPVFLPGESHGQRSLVGHSPQGCKELDMTEATQHTADFMTQYYCLAITSKFWPVGIKEQIKKGTNAPFKEIFWKFNTGTFFFLQELINSHIQLQEVRTRKCSLYFFCLCLDKNCRLYHQGKKGGSILGGSWKPHGPIKHH